MEENERNKETLLSLREFTNLWNERDRRYDERDRRYEERFKAQELAVAAALASSEKQQAAAYASSEKAILKQEEAQLTYDHSHNDLLTKMREQYSEMVPKETYVVGHNTLIDKIDELKDDNIKRHDEMKKEIQIIKEELKETGGKDIRSTNERTKQQWTIGILVCGISLIIGGCSLISTIGMWIILNFVVK
jgi:hypothetical protein